jgi:high mobility group protein B3
LRIELTTNNQLSIMVANKLNLAIANMIDNKIAEYISAITEEYENCEADKLHEIWEAVCGTTPKSTKTKKEKDPNAPKPPLTSFMRFSQAKREEVKKKNPDMKGKEITSEIGRLWNAMSEKGQAKYKKEYEKEKEEYLKAKTEYESKNSEKEKPEKKEVSKKNSSKVEKSACIWEMVRGDRKGEACGKPCEENSSHCKDHAKMAAKKNVKSPTKPKPKSPSTSETKMIKITMHKKFKKPWNVETGFVFEKKDGDFVVVSKIENDEIVDLTEEDIAICKKRDLPYYKEEGEEEEEVEEEEEEEVEEEEVEEEEVEEEEVEEEEEEEEE